ncbi:MAG: hypothetical protein IJS86_01155 [Lachnospiraceae bacterium]|nr:hypothetical protein [Lachnospiraceae bacterium]
MDYNVFCEEVKDRVRDICGEDFNVSVRDTLKNNSVILKGLVIMGKESNVAPSIYLEEFYTDHCDGRDMDDIVNDILKLYAKNRDCGNLDVNLFNNFEEIRSRITYKLINYESNLSLLQTLPHRRFLDLAVVYLVVLGETPRGQATVTIHTEHMENWGTTEEELWKLAADNAPRLSKPEIMSLCDLVKDMMGQMPDMMDEGIPADAGMYVLTNTSRINGVACMLYDDVVSGFAGGLGKDLYIIPSSIHEVIMMPADGYTDVDRMIDIIKEVNSTQVGEEEILSYRLYRYSRSADRISCL